MTQLILSALPNIPEVRPHDDVGELVCTGLLAADIDLQLGDVIAIAQKIVSKSEGRFVTLADVTPSAEALEVAAQAAKDPRLVELILQESTEISRMRKGVLVTRHRLGFVSANSGIDRSNVPQVGTDERVLLLPVDPDGSARKIRQTVFDRLGVEVGVVITDSHGRPHRLGTTGVAIGAAGLPTLLDERGKVDRDGHVLQATMIGIGDEIGAATSLLMGASAESTPIIHLRGLQLMGDGKASDQYRPIDKDLYR